MAPQPDRESLGRLRPEMLLLLEACRPPRAAPLYRGEPLDAPLLARLAAFHRVSALVLASRAPVPEWAMAPLRSDALRARYRGLNAASCLRPILRAFAAASLPVILLKGIQLMDEVYAEPGQRPLSDVDLLIQPERLADALAILRDLGYRADGRRAAFGLARDREIKLTGSGAFRMAVDLHTSLNRPTRHNGYPMPAVWSRARARPLEGLPALALGHADNLVFLCAHATPHGFAQLIWLCDIARAAGAFPPERGEFVRVARECRATRASWAGLMLVEQWLGCAAAGPLREALEDGARFAPGLRHLLTPARILGGHRYSTLASVRLRVALSDTRRDALGLLWATARHRAEEQGRGLFMPKATDRLE